MIIDTHSHLNFNAYKKDFNEVIKKTLTEDIWAINVGTKFETSERAVNLAKMYNKGIYAAIGLHPIYAAAEFQKIKTDPEEGEFLIKEQDFNKEAYRKLALSGTEESKKVVAVGEIGLDYYYKPKTNLKLEQFKKKQKQVFLQQLELAKELNLPVILHCRMAHDDVIEILTLRQAQGKNQKGVIHCFTGTAEQAQKYMNMGFYLGINGIIFKFNIDEVIKNAPLEKLLVETDCPYLTPPQELGKRNEPIFIKHTIQRIAKLKGISFEEVADKTAQNARKLFRI
ncbi:MAG: TatD family hydrolase [Candidatus Staskawiczbacteria bacterium]|nr:TatD family hydrolase [Candidatus Staskawiczbacteria bacterium]MBI3337636.1 TatD family hydrolase [Candidatus Staskawiczbacteria bacterium]